MTLIQMISALIVLAGLFGAINYFVFRVPQAIGICVVTLCASVVMFGVDSLFPGLQIVSHARETVNSLEFSDTLLEGMLGLLLFAGALHVSLSDLRQQATIIFLMATLGVALSTAVVGFGLSWVTGMPLLAALVFGALISPTDPVAVLGVLRNANIRKSLEVKIAGESLFNDGIAYVAFLILASMAFPSESDHAVGATDIAILFGQEAIGGVVLGGILGWLVYQIIRRIDDPSLEVLLTLGLAFGGYSLAMALHVSAPLMAVVAGLFVGNVGTRDGMSEATREYVDIFWRLIDEILNAVLFLLIGFEVFAISFDLDMVSTMALSLGLALLARAVAVIVPITLLRPFRGFDADVAPMMTWGGIKGGISIALALALPESEYKPIILASTYGVVIFSILVQGLTVGKLASALNRATRQAPA